MKHVKVILLAALVTTAFAARAQDAQKVQFDPGGWLVTGAFQNRGEFDSRELPRFVSAEPAIKAESSGYLVRQSRLRFGITVPTDSYLANATIKGFVEADFLGGTPSTASTVDPVIPRLRHAYMAATWKQAANLTLTVGQTWGVAMPAPSGWGVSLTHLAVPRFGGGGVLYRRAPQVRVSADIPAGPLNFYVAGAALTAGDISSASSNSPGGNQSTIPNFEGRVAGQMKMSGPLKYVEVGLNGLVGQERWTTDPAGGALTEAVNATNTMFSADAKVDFGLVALVGGAFSGGNLDNYNAVAGLAVTGTPATRYGVLIDTSNPAAPKAYEVKSQGAWGQLQVNPIKGLQIVAGLGFENPDDSTLKLPSAPNVANGMILRNTQYSGGIIFGLTSKWRVSFEATRYLTFVRAVPQNDTIAGNQFEIGSLLAI